MLKSEEKKPTKATAVVKTNEVNAPFQSCYKIKHPKKSFSKHSRVFMLFNEARGFSL